MKLHNAILYYTVTLTSNILCDAELSRELKREARVAFWFLLFPFPPGWVDFFSFGLLWRAFPSLSAKQHAQRGEKRRGGGER
jgi:hypothetical protein